MVFSVQTSSPQTERAPLGLPFGLPLTPQRDATRNRTAPVREFEVRSPGQVVSRQARDSGRRDGGVGVEFVACILISMYIIYIYVYIYIYMYACFFFFFWGGGGLGVVAFHAAIQLVLWYACRRLGSDLVRLSCAAHRSTDEILQVIIFLWFPFESTKPGMHTHGWPQGGFPVVYRARRS